MRHLRILILLCAGLAVFAACHNAEDPDHKASRQAAEQAYQLLIKGKYDDFVQRIYYADSLTDTYRRQLADRMAEYMAAEAGQHGGIVSAIATHDTLFDGQAHVFLEVTFGDGSHHEIGVPMVKVGKHWRLQ